MCNVQHIVTNHTEGQNYRNKEQHCLLPSLVDDFTCVHSKNALLIHILSTLFSRTSVLAHLLALSHMVTGPAYNSELLHVYTLSHTLCSSSDTLTLKIQQYKHKTHGFCTFSCFGPHIWNSLPLLNPLIF